ncbi:MAG: D-2-hydroxyacid dehydrogenase [Clostridia bacterium]|nr:D-2-hydroxyacid dehydrogenase [Clostridia bacterium]
MKIVLLDAMTLGDDISLDILKNLGECVIYGNIENELIEGALSDADVCVTNKKLLGKHNLEGCKNLKLICLTATGYNNVDVEYCRKKNIKVRNVPGYCTESVCQHTFALLLNLMESLSYYDNFVKNGSYTKSGVANHLAKPFCEIAGKVWGIIGMGGIGREVGKVATAFGARVVYAPVSGKSRKEAFEEVDMDTLFGESDIISIHSPLNEKTENLVNMDKIRLMKKDAVIINVGRGAIVNSHDLVEAVDEGLIRGAGVDVYPKEPPSEKDPFMNIKHPERFVLTPHIAWASIEARQRCVDIVGENIKAFMENRGCNDVW